MAAMMACAMVIAGCHTVGQVMSKTAKVIADPSIPVGDVSDQPTQIALSLYATEDVNPNPKSGPAVEDDTAPSDPPRPDHPAATSALSNAPSIAPYVVHLQGTSEADLIAQLQGLVAALQKDDQDKAAMTPATAHTGSPPTSSPDSTAAASMPWWRPRPPGAAMNVPYLTPSLVAPSSAMPMRALGQYGDALATTPPATPQPTQVATPITFRVFQLKDDSLFLATAYEPLVHDAKKVLGSAFLAEDTYVLKPGQFKYVGFAPVDTHTHYIAIVASYHNLDGSHWKRSFRIEPTGYRYPLLIRFAATGVSIQDDGR